MGRTAQQGNSSVQIIAELADTSSRTPYGTHYELTESKRGAVIYVDGSVDQRTADIAICRDLLRAEGFEEVAVHEDGQADWPLRIRTGVKCLVKLLSEQPGLVLILPQRSYMDRSPTDRQWLNATVAALSGQIRTAVREPRS